LIKRYSTPETDKLWSDEYKFRLWWKVEVAVCEVWNELEKISDIDLQNIKRSSPPPPSKAQEIEKTVQHEVLAFLEAWKADHHLKDSGRYLHLGLTSSDLLDTYLSLQLRECASLIEEELSALLSLVQKLAQEYKYTLMIGRTHGMHAENITFGYKVAVWYDDLRRGMERLHWGREQISVGMFSGTVGMYHNLSPEFEQKVCEKLGLANVKISTQIISRDRYTDFVYALIILSCVIERIALELRHLQRTEVAEVMEGFSKGQKGSSAMPHKRNPWKSENLCGLARVMRAQLSPMMESIALWHERDMSNSSVERIVFMESTSLIHFMLRRLRMILGGGGGE